MSRPAASVFIATSVDGFIARADGAIDWLPGPEAAGSPSPSAAAPEDYGYGAFMASIDTLVIGRKTWDQVRSFGFWPYAGKQVVVWTRQPSLLTLPPDLADTVQASADAPSRLVERLAARGAKQLYVDGGQTVTAFLAAGLIDRLIVTRIPVLLGGGIPLFGALPRDIVLQHIATRSYPTGLVQSEYRVGPV